MQMPFVIHKKISVELQKSMQTNFCRTMCHMPEMFSLNTFCHTCSFIVSQIKLCAS